MHLCYQEEISLKLPGRCGNHAPLRFFFFHAWRRNFPPSLFTHTHNRPFSRTHTTDCCRNSNPATAVLLCSLCCLDTKCHTRLADFFQSSIYTSSSRRVPNQNTCRCMCGNVSIKSQISLASCFFGHQIRSVSTHSPLLVGEAAEPWMVVLRGSGILWATFTEVFVREEIRKYRNVERKNEHLRGLRVFITWYTWCDALLKTSPTRILQMEVPYPSRKNTIYLLYRKYDYLCMLYSKESRHSKQVN